MNVFTNIRCLAEILSKWKRVEKEMENSREDEGCLTRSVEDGGLTDSNLLVSFSPKPRGWIMMMMGVAHREYVPQ